MVSIDLGLLTCKKVEDALYGRMVVCIGACGKNLDERFISISAYEPKRPLQLIFVYDEVSEAALDFAKVENTQWVLIYSENKEKATFNRVGTNSILYTLPLN